MSIDVTSTSQYEEETSNLANITPYEGMKVEIRDPDYIWSAATVISIVRDSSASDLQADQNNVNSITTNLTKTSAHNTNQCLVTLRYDGWGDEWNEVLPWCHPRLAKLFTYTKKVKCFVHIPRISLSSNSSYKRNMKKRNNKFISAWPCSVCFRMPHPGSKESKVLLKTENKIFAQPFGNSLPKKVLSFFNNKSDGGWIHWNKVRQWRTYTFDEVYWQFEDACKLAESASLGNLPVKPFESGTLLRNIYQTKKIGGDALEGISPGGFKIVSTAFRDNSKTTEPCEKKSSLDLKGNDSDSDESSDLEYYPPTYEPPPTLPSPIQMKETIDKNIKLHKKTKKWGLTTNINGNDIFVQSFPTQSQAVVMRELVFQEYLKKTANEDDEQSKKFKACQKNFEMLENVSKAREMDLKCANLEACTAPLENWKAQNNFSMHDWTVQSIRHDEYLFEKANGKASFEKRKMMSKHKICGHHNAASRKNKRKQTKPLKVNLLRNIYDSKTH